MKNSALFDAPPPPASPNFMSPSIFITFIMSFLGLDAGLPSVVVVCSHAQVLIQALFLGGGRRGTSQIILKRVCVEGAA